MIRVFMHTTRASSYQQTVLFEIEDRSENEDQADGHRSKPYDPCDKEGNNPPTQDVTAKDRFGKCCGARVLGVVHDNEPKVSIENQLLCVR
jgi:hypothetical protein